MLRLNRAACAAMARLSGFAAVALILVSTVFYLVRPAIERQETEALFAEFRAIAPELAFAPDFLAHPRKMTLGERPVTVYTALRNEKPVAYFIRATTTQGYNGAITLLIGIVPDNTTLIGVRTLEHHETPGLGDKIETRVSRWIHEFDGKSLTTDHFAVRKDGGDFDAFTGATITPRAVTNLVGDILRAWQKQQRDKR